MGLWVKLRDRLLDLAGKYLASLLEDDKPSADAPAAPADPAPTPAQETPQEAAETASGAPAGDGAAEPTAAPLEACVRASCWNGKNAETRYMNMLSPKFSDSKFAEYLSWTIAQGCDHVHLILMNEGDGEGSGYDCGDSATLRKAEERIRTIRVKGLGVILWIVTDDSSSYRKKLFADPGKYVGRMASLFKFASCVCLGLEMDEGGASESNWKSVKSALLKVWSGPIATHHTSAKYSFIGLGEVVMDQLDPNCTTSQIRSSVKNLKAKGKIVFGFEYDRQPNATKAKAALDAGAQGVGNWAGGSPAAAPSENDDVDFASLKWNYGGFKPSSTATIVARIASLKISGDGLSYKWADGGCERMGASSKEDAACLACLFCKVGGSWTGGKFDWISTSRLKRGFENIRGRYNGWDPEALDKASEFTFVIVSSDGRKRTNVISAKRS